MLAEWYRFLSVLCNSGACWLLTFGSVLAQETCDETLAGYTFGYGSRWKHDKNTCQIGSWCENMWSLEFCEIFAMRFRVFVRLIFTAHVQYATGTNITMILYYIIRHYAILYYTVTYYTELYYAIPYPAIYTVLYITHTHM